MVVGVLDGIHITIVAPDHENKVDYFNRKQHKLLLMKASYFDQLLPDILVVCMNYEF